MFTQLILDLLLLEYKHKTIPQMHLPLMEIQYAQDLDFNSDGTYAYVGGSRHGLVFKYGLTTAYDFSTIDTACI